MNKLTLAALAAVTLISASAFATPIALPGGPLYLESRTAEQYSKTNDINNAANPARPGTPEGNWGVIEITTISVGTILPPTGSQIAGPGAPIFSDGQNGGEQILGIFYGILNNPGGPPNTSRGGILDLYFWTNSHQSITAPLSSADLSRRGTGGSQNGNSASAAPSEYSGFTCLPNTPGCTFLVRLNLASGADVNSQINTIISPTGSTFESYLSVDTTTVGAWTGLLDSNFFTLNPSNQVCGAAGVSCTSPNDLRSDGNLFGSGANGWDVAGTDIVGLRKNATVRAFVVPEPEGLALLGIGLAVAGLVSIPRRRLPQRQPAAPDRFESAT